MPYLVIAIVEDQDTEKVRAKIPLKTPLAMQRLDEQDLRTYPLETILELSVRPAAIAVVRAWRDRSAI